MVTGVFISAGETSGDIHSAILVREMKKIIPNLEFTGLGGDMMAEEGVELTAHIKDYSFMGFVEVLKHIPAVNRLMRKSLDTVITGNIPLVILVDYPGFNLRFAEKLRRRTGGNVRIYYYISPQVWAWGNARIPKIAKLIDRMAVILPFEEQVYADSGLDVKFVGHPLIEEMEEFCGREDFLKRHNLKDNLPIIGLLPGSRHQEVRRILPAMIKAAEIIAEEYPAQFLTAGASNVSAELYSIPSSIKLVRNDTRNLIRHSRLVITKSGTSTLEAAIAGTPMVVVYKMNPLSYLIGKRLVKIKNIALANVTAGKRIAPELVQKDASPDNIAREALKLLRDDSIRNEQIKELKFVKDKLGGTGASKRAAESACGLLEDIYNERH